MIKSVFDTSLPDHWSKSCFQEYQYDIAPEHFTKIMHIIFNATADMLNKSKVQKQPVVMSFNKLSGELIAAAICQYFENEDPNAPGNFTLVWTFDESDIPDNAAKIDFMNPDTYPFYRAWAGKKWNIEFNSVGDMVNLINLSLSETKKYLDENASETEEVGVEIEDIMTARVAVEDGVKVFAIEPAQLIKQLVKNDAAIEK